MSRSTLLCGVSAAAVMLSLAFSSAAAQEALPAIDIGGAQVGAGTSTPVPSTSAGGDNPGGRMTGYNAVNASSAMKMDTPILQTPVAVQVVSRQTMDDQQAISVADSVLTNVSSVSLNPTGLYDNFNIRGFTTNYNTYRNGLIEHYVTNLDTSNLQSIEVLKGPAAMLYGRVEPGGLLDLVVKRPLETPYYSVQQQVGSYGLTRTVVDATGPLTADHTWLYRISGDYLHSESFVDYVNSETGFVAPTITYHPNEQFRLNSDAEFQNTKQVDLYQQIPAYGNRPAPLPITRYLQDPSVTSKFPDTEIRELIGYDWTYNIDSNWSITNRFAYEHAYFDFNTTYFSTPNYLTGNANRTLYMNPSYLGTIATNLDIKGKFDTGLLSHSTLVGVDFYTQNRDQYNGFIGSTPFLSPVNIYAPVPGPGVPFQPRVNSLGYDREYWKGVYFQDMISAFDDRVHLLLGGRYDWADVTNAYGSSSWVQTVFNAVKVHDEGFSPRVGLLVQPLPWVSFYGNYTQSLGANNGVTLNNQPLPPQRGTQWEGGVKAELFDKRLTATFAYYDITKTNIPTPDLANPQLSDVVGKAESKGVEVDLTGRVTENWSVIANYSHDYAIITQDNSGNVGHRLPSVPANAGNIWVKWDGTTGALKGWSAGAGVSIVGEMQGDNANDFQLPRYALLNAMVAYRFKFQGMNVTAQVNAKNLTDANYFSAAFNRSTITTGTPRTIIGSLRFEF
jgi:iron complex outermembrane recepter protein